MVVPSAGPTDFIFSPSTRTIWFSNILPDLLSNRCPARMATVFTCAFVVKLTAKSSDSSGKRSFQEFNVVLRTRNLAATDTMQLRKNVRLWAEQNQASFPTKRNFFS